jgi:hypothetical protein
MKKPELTLTKNRQTQLGQNWAAFDEKSKENFRRFLRDLPHGETLEQFISWWMSDEKRAASPPYTLGIIMQRWPQAFTSNAGMNPQGLSIS